MPETDKQIVIARLMSNYGVVTRKELMNILQDLGKVSDNAVTIDDCDDSDLIRAYLDTLDK